MKILIIDDDKLVCSSLKMIIEANGHNIVGIGYDGKDAIKFYSKTKPDVLLMDIRMQNINGVQASEEILKKDPSAKILFLTTFSDDEYIVKALTLGVKGYILKQNFESIISALEAVNQGQNVFNTEIVQKIPNLYHKNQPRETNLSEKEIEFITLVAKGFNNKEIAEKLYLSEGTVRNYLSSLLSKLDLKNRTHLAIYYYEYIK